MKLNSAGEFGVIIVEKSPGFKRHWHWHWYRCVPLVFLLLVIKKLDLNCGGDLLKPSREARFLKPFERLINYFQVWLEGPEKSGELLAAYLIILSILSFITITAFSVF